MDLEPTPTAFAILDILGYGRLMERHPNDVFAVVQELIQTSRRNWPIQDDLERWAHFSGDVEPRLEYLQFSDTLLIWLRCEPSGLFSKPQYVIRTVCYAASLTLATFIGAGVPLRGSIGFGPAFISRDPLFFTGKELYLTTKAERAQAWAGAALHASAEAALTDLQEVEPFVLEYEVPMNSPRATVPRLAIDWVTPLCFGKAILPPWDRMFRGIPSEVSLDKKRDETRRFFEAVAARRRSFPLGMDEQTVATIRERMAALLDPR